MAGILMAQAVSRENAIEVHDDLTKISDAFFNIQPLVTAIEHQAELLRSDVGDYLQRLCWMIREQQANGTRSIKHGEDLIYIETIA